LADQENGGCRIVNNKDKPPLLGEDLKNVAEAITKCSKRALTVAEFFCTNQWPGKALRYSHSYLQTGIFSDRILAQRLSLL
jgi:hypothetical protein